jgi:hypothetical protein
MSEFIRQSKDWHFCLDADMLKKEQPKIKESDVAKVIYSELLNSPSSRVLLERIADICKIYKGRRLTDATMVQVDSLALKDRKLVYIDREYIAIRGK